VINVHFKSPADVRPMGKPPAKNRRSIYKADAAMQKLIVGI